MPVTLRVLVATVLAGAALAAMAHDHEAHAAASHEYAWGRAGDASKAARTVRIEMADTLRYAPDRFEVKRGETVKFVVHNAGKLPHEMVIGTERELREHAEAMRKHPDMHHEDPYMVEVAPGGTGQIAWTFTKTGTFAFGCLVPGHWEGGMKGAIVVAP
jgi:uncharacterized cupredoxin-like copper-binding protein